VRNTFVALTFTRYLQLHEPLLWSHASRYRLEEQPVDLKIVRIDRLSFCPASAQKMVTYWSGT
jgi:hypothetical protein